MKITVEIPTALRRFTDGVQSIECTSATLPELLGEIEQRFPAMSKHLRDDAGEMRRFVNIYVNEEDIRFLGGNEYRFQRRRSRAGGAFDCGRSYPRMMRMNRTHPWDTVCTPGGI